MELEAKNHIVEIVIKGVRPKKYPIPFTMIEDVNQKLGRMINRLRVESNLTEQELSEWMKCDVSEIIEMKVGNGKVSLESFLKLCHVFALEPGTVLRKFFT